MPNTHYDTALHSAYLARRHGANQLFKRDAHQISLHSPFFLFVWDAFLAIKIFTGMMFNWSSMLGCALTIGATLLAYYNVPDDGSKWNGQLSDVLLSFAVITPLNQSISMGWS